MPSSYTTSLKLTLPQTGDLIGSWGGVVNSGVTSLVDQAVAGTANITMVADTNYTLSSIDGTSDQARNMFINVSGSHTITTSVICPSVSKLYVVTNNTVGGQSIVFRTFAGTGVTIPNGVRATLYCDGTNVTAISTYGTTDAAVSPFVGSLALTSLDAGITTVADTIGFSGYSAFVTSSFANTTLGMYGNLAAGTTAGVNNASLGLLSFDLASAGMIRTTFAGAPLYFATNAGVKLVIDDAGYTTLFGNGIEGGELRLNNPNNLSVGGALDISIPNTLRLWTPNNNSAMQIGQLGAGLTGGTIGFYTENTQRLQITNTGAVNIGSSGTAGSLVINTSTTGGTGLLVAGSPVGGGVNALLWCTDATAGSATNLVFWNDNGFSANAAFISFFSSGSGNEFRIAQGAAAPMTFHTAGTERMRITATGSVGIGTASPGQKLSVAGTIESTTGGFKFPDGYTLTTSQGIVKAWIRAQITEVAPSSGYYTISTLQSYGISGLVYETAGFPDRFKITFSNAFSNAFYMRNITIWARYTNGGIQYLEPVSITPTEIYSTYPPSTTEYYFYFSSAGIGTVVFLDAMFIGA